MILEKLEMKNFRQFRGINHVEFSKETDQKNITIIFGENGRGKTGIYRAIMYCLYGARRLSQDPESNKDDVYLVNMSSVLEDAESRQPTQAYVELIFRHRNVKYTMRRSLLASCTKGKQKEQDGDVTLLEEGATYDTKEYDDPDEIKEKIDTILDFKVREFFLFDGEKIEMLTRASDTHRNDIARAVRQLLNIDSIAAAIKILREIKKELDDLIKKTAKGNYGKYYHEKTQVADKISENEQRKLDLEDEKDKAARHKEELETKLKKYDGARQKIEEKKNLEETVNDSEKLLQSQRMNLAVMLSDVAPFLCCSAIDQVHAFIAQKQEKKEIPSQIRSELIKDLLQKKKCICGRPIEKNTPECAVLIEWLKEVESTQVIGDSAMKLLYELSPFSVEDGKKTVIKSAKSALSGYMTTENKKRKAEESILSIMEELGGIPNEDITSFTTQLNKTQDDIIRLQAEILNTEKENKNQQEQMEELNARIAKEEKEKNIRGLNQIKRNLAEEAEKRLVFAQDEYIKEIRSKISTETAKNLRIFLDRKSQGFFSAIEVDEKYSLQILDPHGTPFLANISAGLRQLLSLAFITALAQTAAAGNLPEMPLFMDTPFGRLSLEHRLNLINQIPDLCSQWILLATDTELRREEAEELKQTGRLGAFYRLTTLAENETKIELVETEKAIRQLNSGKEVKA